MRTTLAVLLLTGLFGGICLAATPDTPSDANKKSAAADNNGGRSEAAPRTSEGYLGIAIEPLHSRLVERVERLFGKGQGVRVAKVAEASPAAKAGLQADDVVVTYDDQKIYSPVQFDRLVRNDTPGRESTLGIVRDGESKEIKVQIGDRDDTNALRALESLSGERPRRLRTATEEVDGAWSSFDSLVLERTGENHFKAAIKYRDKSGKIASREFQGSIAEIRRSVEAQRDVPAIERQQLLHALAASEYPIEFAASPTQESGTKAPGQVERQEVEWTFIF